MQKAPETALFLLWLLLSPGERDLQQPVPPCPGRGPQNPVYRASHSFFISLPFNPPTPHNMHMPTALPQAPHTAAPPPSVWRAPSLSSRCWPVFLRNLLVWRKLAIPSLVGNIAEPLMWLVAFGYGMGALVGELSVNGTQVPYILFLASGSICMSAMNAASFEALYSAFSRMHVQKTWEGIMNTPVGLDDVLLAEMLWAAFKALFTVTAILGVMLALGISN